MLLIKLKLPITVFVVILLILTRSGENLFSTGPDELNLCDRGDIINNSISFFTTASEYNSLKPTDGVKISLVNCKTIINGDTLLAEGISTRGGSTLLFRRKSYSFSLSSPASFRHGERKEKLKKFYAVSLSMDKNYRSNHLAFEMMNKTGLFDLFNSYGQLHINGKCEGICMVIERPEDWAIGKKNSPFIIRRGYNHLIDKMEYSKVSERSEVENYADYFNLIYSSLKKHNGEDLYKTLNQWIDLDNYMKWLAFNFLVRNGDYTDEVFLYIDPTINKFRIIPWDYDDLFLPYPHEGKEKSRRILGDRMIFSSEDQLDIKIATDPYLYKIYLVQLKELLEQLPAETLKEIFENTYAELYPYYSDNEIISMSEFDSHKGTSLSGLENDLRSLYKQLNPFYSFYLNYLKAMN
jgi:spore coat protein H